MDIYYRYQIKIQKREFFYENWNVKMKKRQGYFPNLKTKELLKQICCNNSPSSIGKNNKMF